MTKVYPDGSRAVVDVDLVIPDGQLAVLVGPSGCGKTTLLRMVAGLESITDGEIRIGDRIVNKVPPKERDVAMVFQNYALYPHMSVFDNMAFSLKMRRSSRAEIDTRVHSTARTLGLQELLQKKPKHLSGGQRQRVAMGRAIVREPQAFLMDEPLSNLDAKLRVQMRAEIGRLQRALGVTTIYVTHDQTEAMTLGDSVAVMKLGVLQQVDAPQNLYQRPANVFVAGFIGSPAMNLAEAALEADAEGLLVSIGQARIRIAGEAAASRPALRNYVGRPVILGIRPEDMDEASPADSEAGRVIHSTVELREEMGAESYVYFNLDAVPVLTDDIRELAADTDAASLDDLKRQASARKTRFVARLNPRARAREGEPVHVCVDTRSLHFFDPESGDAIDHSAPGGTRETIALRP